MAAGAVSGMLALVQEYLKNTLGADAQPGAAQGAADQRGAAVEPAVGFEHGAGGEPGGLGPAQSDQQHSCAIEPDQRQSVRWCFLIRVRPTRCRPGSGTTTALALAGERDQLSVAHHAGLDRSAGQSGGGAGAGQRSGFGGDGRDGEQCLYREQFSAGRYLHRGERERTTRPPATWSTTWRMFI